MYVAKTLHVHIAFVITIRCLTIIQAGINWLKLKMASRPMRPTCTVSISRSVSCSVQPPPSIGAALLEGAEEEPDNGSKEGRRMEIVEGTPRPRTKSPG